MADSFSGRGDPIKVLELLWGRVAPPKRGPKARVELDELVAAAVRIADAEGIDAVSTRRVAEAVGISPMSFYTYIPDKAVLIDLMLDAVAKPGGEDMPGSPPFDPAEWRANLTMIARSFRAFYLRHPWALEIGTHRPVFGPNTLRAYEFILSAVDGLGLDPVSMDLTVTTIANYVHGAAREVTRAHMVKQRTGLSDDEWWYRIEPFMKTIDFSPYPVSSRIGPIVGEQYGLGDPELAFDYGLELILDGLAARIARQA